MTMTRPRVWRRAALFLIFGLELPTLVLTGLYFSSEATAGWEDPWRSIVVLSSSLGFYTLGTLVIWWAAVKIYRHQKKPIEPAGRPTQNRPIEE